jgi:hypothetical protein
MCVTTEYSGEYPRILLEKQSELNPIQHVLYVALLVALQYCKGTEHLYRVKRKIVNRVGYSSHFATADTVSTTHCTILSTIWLHTTYSAVDDVQVKLSVFGSVLNRIEQHLFTLPEPSTTTAAAATAAATSTTAASSDAVASEHVAVTFLGTIPKSVVQSVKDMSDNSAESQSTSATATTSTDSLSESLSLSTGAVGYGRSLDNAAYANLASTLDALQIPPAAISIVQDYPIGSGGFAKVYKAQYDGKLCAAKVSSKSIIRAY